MCVFVCVYVYVCRKGERWGGWGKTYHCFLCVCGSGGTQGKGTAGGGEEGGRVERGGGGAGGEEATAEHG